MKNLVSWAKEELARLRIISPRPNKRLSLPARTALASVNSLKLLPQEQEVVLEADLYLQCAKCQERIADILSTMDGMDSVMLHVLEKKVTISRRMSI